MKHEESVFEEQEYKGEWWLQENPENKVPGILRGCVASGFRLELMGCFKQEPKLFTNRKRASATNEEDTPPIICGKTFSGRFTLFNSFQVRGNTCLHGLQTRIYYCGIVVKNSSFNLDSFEELRFRKVSCKLSNLCNWIDGKVFSETFAEMLTKKGGVFEIKFDFSYEKTVYEDEKYIIKLQFNFSGPEHRIGQNDVKIEWELIFVIECKGKELPWASDKSLCFCSIVNKLSRFLSIATFDKCYPFDIVGYSKQFETQIEGEKITKTYPLPIELYHEQNIQKIKYNDFKKLFSWEIIANNPIPYFKKWFSIFSEISSPVGLFIDSLSRENSYSPERFFNLIITLEGLHRFKNPESGVATKEHSRRVDIILNSTPAEHREWLSEVLVLSHQPSLRKRLEDLVRPFRELFDWLIGNEGNRKQRCKWRFMVLKKIADTRNSIGHSLPTSKGGTRKCDFYFTGLAELIIAMFLMKEIGIDDEIIAKRIQKNYLVSQYRDRLVKFLKKELFAIS